MARDETATEGGRGKHRNEIGDAGYDRRNRGQAVQAISARKHHHPGARYTVARQTVAS